MSNKNEKNRTLRQQFNDFIDSETKKYQKIYGFKIEPKNGEHATHNNESDAFKHAYMQAVISLKSFDIVSQAVGDWHEYVDGPKTGQPEGELNMDLWNNAVGRRIAKEIREEGKHRLIKKSEINDIVAKKIIQSMKKGDLITHPNDSRKYVEPRDKRTPGQKFDEEGRLISLPADKN